MTTQQVNYDDIAPEYDKRFASSGSAGTEQGLLRLACATNANKLLEVGCGTGYWLAALHSVDRQVYGLDLSIRMLHHAQKRLESARLVNATAVRLPFENNSFDMIFCVNAIHHFQEPQTFIHEAQRVLKANGTLAVIGTDPHGHKDSWYGFQYFDGTFENDLRTFPRWTTVAGWMAQLDFEHIQLQKLERIFEVKRGRQVLNDPFLHKNSCSRLAGLSEEAYHAGMQRIELNLTRAEAHGETLVFQTDIEISMLIGEKGGNRCDKLNGNS